MLDLLKIEDIISLKNVAPIDSTPKLPSGVLYVLKTLSRI